MKFLLGLLLLFQRITTSLSSGSASTEYQRLFQHESKIVDSFDLEGETQFGRVIASDYLRGVIFISTTSPTSSSSISTSVRMFQYCEETIVNNVRGVSEGTGNMSVPTATATVASSFVVAASYSDPCIEKTSSPSSTTTTSTHREKSKAASAMFSWRLVQTITMPPPLLPTHININTNINTNINNSDGNIDEGEGEGDSFGSSLCTCGGVLFVGAPRHNAVFVYSFTSTSTPTSSSTSTSPLSLIQALSVNAAGSEGGIGVGIGVGVGVGEGPSATPGARFGAALACVETEVGVGGVGVGVGMGIVLVVAAPDDVTAPPHAPPRSTYTMRTTPNINTDINTDTDMIDNDKTMQEEAVKGVEVEVEVEVEEVKEVDSGAVFTFQCLDNK